MLELHYNQLLCIFLTRMSKLHKQEISKRHAYSGYYPRCKWCEVAAKDETTIYCPKVKQ